MAAGFEDVVEADDVGLDIGIGILDAVTDAGLGCEVDDNIELPFGKEVVDKGLVGNVTLNELIGDR